MNVILKACNVDDLDELQEISVVTYLDTFGAFNTESNMNEYLERAFDKNVLKAELMNEASYFYFLYVENEIAGYYKVNEHMAQTDIKDHNSIEIERIIMPPFVKT